MFLLDKRFRKHRFRYLFQCAIATLSAMAVLVVLDLVANAVTVASLGASSFIIFCLPHQPASRPRRLIGGYLAGIAAGTLCYWLPKIPWLAGMPFLHDNAAVIFGGLAVGLAMFLMVTLNCEHPPAASLALGLVLAPWAWLTVLVAIVEIIMLCTLKRLLKPVLIDLL